MWGDVKGRVLIIVVIVDIVFDLCECCFVVGVDDVIFKLVVMDVLFEVMGSIFVCGVEGDGMIG